MRSALQGLEPEGQAPSAVTADPFGAHYQDYRDRLMRYCLARVRDWDTAEEIVQDAFVKAYAAREQLRDADAFYPWLRTTAQRLIIDHHRRGGRVVTLPEVETRQELGAEDVVLSRLENDELRLAFQRVAARHREVLRLRDYEGLSYEAIAQRLLCPLTAVPPLLHRARAALRREYLALTSAERLALVPGLGAAVGAFRRVRDRAMQGLSSLPDLAGLSAPAASLLVGVNAMVLSVVGGAAPEALEELTLFTDEVPSFGADVETIPASADGIGSEASGSTTGGGEDEEPPQQYDLPVGEIHLREENERSRYMYERSRRMPIFIEVETPVEGVKPYVAADPEAMQSDISDTISGGNPREGEEADPGS